MSDLPERLSLREVGPRDGLQNEAPVPTAGKVALIDALSRTGVGRIEAVSFVHPRAIPSMADAAEVWAAVQRNPDVRYSALVPNLKGAERALEAGFTEIEVVVSASDTHNRKNVNRSTEESLDDIAAILDLAHGGGCTVQVIVSTAWGCPYEGEVPVERVLSRGGPGAGRRRRHPVVRRHDRHGHARRGSPAWWGRPGRRTRTPRSTCTSTTPGAPAWPTCWRPSSSGVSDFDASVGGLGGCPYAPGATGNIATEELVHMVEDMGVATGVDLEAMIEVAAQAETLVGRTLPSQVLRAGPRTRTIA